MLKRILERRLTTGSVFRRPFVTKTGRSNIITRFFQLNTINLRTGMGRGRQRQLLNRLRPRITIPRTMLKFS